MLLYPRTYIILQCLKTHHLINLVLMRFIILTWTLLWMTSTVLQAQQGCAPHLQDFWERLPQEKVYVHTDRTLYEPNENIWFKAYVLDAQLLANSPSQILRTELIAPNGQVVEERRLVIWEGSAQGDFTLAPDAVGGVYTLRAYTLWQKNMPEALIFEKALTVKKQLLPDILMTLDFQRESYGAAMKVVADLELRSKDNKALALHKFDYQLRLAGKTSFRKSMKTEWDGRAKIEFELPKELNTADVILSVLVEHGGSLESISRAVPILTQKVDLQFLPEGGHALLNSKHRIAFRAVDEFGKPVDIKGYIYNDKDQVVADFESYHQGMGSFYFTAKEGRSYYAKITEPTALEQEYELPASLSDGVALSINPKENLLDLEVYASNTETLCVLVQMRDSIYYEQSWGVESGTNHLSLSTKDWPIGVAQITILDNDARPEAERLCFVNKNRQLNIKMKTNKAEYQIRDSVILDLWVKDALGHPVVADLSLAVVDDKNWTLADDQQDHILSKLLLSSDLRGEIFEPNFYFDPQEPKADTALDYVMLTHGYRRFQWKDLKASVVDKVQYPAEPCQIVEGQLSRLGQALPNHKIKVTTADGSSCEDLPIYIQSDENGNFIIPEIACDVPIQLHSQLAGRWSHSAAITQLLNPKGTIQDPQRGTGVRFEAKTNASNTRHFNNIFSMPQAEGRVYQSPTSADYTASINGTIIDEKGITMPFANIALYDVYGDLVCGTSSDFDGNYKLKDVPLGVYNMEVSFVGYPKYQLSSISLEQGKNLHVDITYREQLLRVMNSELIVDEVVVEGYYIPLLTETTAMSNILGVEDIQRMGVRNIQTLLSSTSGVNATDLGEALSQNASRPQGATTRLDRRRLRREQRQNRRSARQEARAAAAAQSRSASNNPELVYENSMLYEMQRAKGELPQHTQHNGRNSIALNNNSSPSDAFIKFNIKPSENQQPYRARVFYAPDYSEYHRHRKSFSKVSPIRKDFRKTIYWQPYVKTDSSGHAQMLFFNADAISSYRIIIEGRSSQGELLHEEHTYAVQMPFELNAKIPKYLSKGDSLYLPITLRNNTNDTITGQLKINHDLISSTTTPTTISIAPKAFVQQEFNYYVTHYSAREKRFQLIFETEGFREEVVVEYEVQEKLFPMSKTIASNALNFEQDFDIDSLVPASLEGHFEIHINPLNSFMKGVEQMIKHPYGCFEQVSSANYPNILALQLMQQTQTLRPDINSRALNYLDQGYKKLAGYECSTGGWEWYGRDPAHEVLTAYGLMQLKDMQEVYNKVDPVMLQRAKKWLLSRKDKEGGWEIDGKHYGWGNAKVVSNAYILYALAYIGVDDLEKERLAISEEARESGDLYRLGLASLANFQLKKRKVAEALFAQMREHIQKQGLERQLQADCTVNYARGKALHVQILSFAILAGLASHEIEEQELSNYYNALMRQCQHGGFGGTQATVWALKAILAYNQTFPLEQSKDAELALWINDQLVRQFPLRENMLLNPKVDSLEKFLQEGKNTLRVELRGLKTAPLYEFAADWLVQQPPSAAQASLAMKTQLKESKVQQAETVRLEVTLSNLSELGAPSPIAVIGLPAGLSPELWQLKAMQDRAEFDYYELKDNFLILYFRGLKPQELRQLNFDLKAEVPGVYQAPASSCYLYYEPEHKFWLAGEKVRIL